MSSIVDKRTQEPEHGVDGANSKRPRFSSEEKEFKAGASEEKPELIEDVFSIVMSMLAPKEMLCLSCCSKSLMKMVTHQNVVRNAIMTGGHARRSLKCIIDLMKERKIYFPSALRLLRIACGQMCEMPGCYKVVHTVRSSFGIFCCSRYEMWFATGNSGKSVLSQAGPFKFIIVASSLRALLISWGSLQSFGLRTKNFGRRSTMLVLLDMITNVKFVC
jgi:hypothetical protein